jgi:erythronate-4-phosphate dehydrogenase
MAALLMLVERHGMLVPDLTLGVIGVGQVGSRVVEKAAALGMKVLQNDPPRRLQEGLPELLDLDQVLMESDVITLHVPLIRDGPFRTEHLADHRFFEQLAGGVLFINTSRGEVVDSDALRTALGRGWVLAAALDVWEGEPDLSLDLLEHVEIATPHIAGYSFEGKLSGSTMVYEDVCRFFEVECRRDYASLYPPWEEPCLRLDERGRLAQDVIHQAVQRAYAILDDDERLRAGIRRDADARQSLFRRLRRDYPVRREFGAWKIDSSPLTETLARALAGLGFQLDTEGETR